MVTAVVVCQPKFGLVTAGPVTAGRLSSGEFWRFLVRSGLAVEARIGLFWSGALRFVRSRYVSAVGLWQVRAWSGRVRYGGRGSACFGDFRLVAVSLGG